MVLVNRASKKFLDSADVAWRKFSHGTGVLKDHSNKDFNEHFNVSLFKVVCSGEFPKHRHNHSHIIYFLSGKGER
jgi:quercetin dioxygenase-like cupin family protein